MGRHHPSEVRDVVTLRLAPSERLLLERALSLRYPLQSSRSHSLGEFIREAACQVAHQVLAAAPAAPDPRQVDLEDLIKAHGGGAAGPLRWRSSPAGVATAPSPLEAAEYVVKPDRRRDGTVWRVELHREHPPAGQHRIKVLASRAAKTSAMAYAESSVRVALRTRPTPPERAAAAGRRRQGGKP